VTVYKLCCGMNIESPLISNYVALSLKLNFLISTASV
jgi:hypothetical protein